MSHDKKYSTILTTVQHESLTAVLHEEILGRMPLSKRVMNTVLQVEELVGRRLSGTVKFSAFAFVVKGRGKSKPVWRETEMES